MEAVLFLGMLALVNLGLLTIINTQKQKK